MTSEFDELPDVVKPERDQWGRPLLLTPAGNLVAHTRISTMSGYIGDTSALNTWMQRLLAVGLGRRPDLAALLASFPAIHSDIAGGKPTAAQKREDKATKAAIDEVIGRALDEARQHQKADWGTAIHQFVELGVKGEEVDAIPERMESDVAAIEALLEPFEVLASERFVINDTYGSAGTLDLILRRKDGTELPRVADIKTGTLHPDQLPIQLHQYASGQVYDVDTDRRGADLAGRVDQKWAYTIHAPAGQGRADLHRVDIGAGRAAVEHCLWVRDWRSSSKSLVTKVAQ